MKKLFPTIIVLILINSQFVFAQSKTQNYYDDNLKTLSKSEFNTLSKQKGYRTTQYKVDNQAGDYILNLGEFGKHEILEDIQTLKNNH